MKQKPQKDSRHNMRMMYAQAMHDQKNEMEKEPTSEVIEQKPLLCKDLPSDCVDILCYFKGKDGFIICRVGHWNTLLQRFRIHSDGLDRYYKEIIEWQNIPIMISVI